MLPANLEREIESAALIRNLQQRVRRLETLEETGCFNLIEHTEGTSLSFASPLPTNFKHLYLVYSVAALTSPVGDSIGIRFNGDVGSNYEWIRRLWAQDGVGGNSEATFTDADAGDSTYANIGLEGPFTTSHAAGFALIPDYLDTTKHKSYVAEGFSKVLSPAAYHLFKLGGRWKDISAISSIEVPGTYISNSIMSLYGLC